MKKESSLKSILAILIIILLCLVSFGGIYVKDKNIMKNWLPDYVLGMDTGTDTIIKLDVLKDEDNSSEDTQNLVGEIEDGATVEGIENSEDENASDNENTQTENGQAENVYTLDNYKKSKEIIEKRLKLSGINQYTLRLDEESGSIVMEFPESGDINILNNILVPGKVEFTIEKNVSDATDNNESVENNETTENAENIDDTENSENTDNEENSTQEQVNEITGVIADKSAIKNITTSIVETYIEENNLGYVSCVKMNIDFTSDAVKKFKEIKNSYVIPKDENGVEVDNAIYIYIDGRKFYEGTESEFLEIAVNGSLPIKYGSYSNDIKLLNDRLEVANSEKAVMETEALPINYQGVYGNTVESNISKLGIVSVFVVILAVMCIYLAFKYAVKGIFAELSILGFGAMLLLVLRWTSVQISVASIVSIAGMLIAQFIYLIKVLNNKKISSNVFTEKTIEFSKMIIPAFILGVVAAILPALKNIGIIPGNIFDIANFGMVIFWGIIIFEIFNNIITRAILTNAKNK